MTCMTAYMLPAIKVPGVTCAALTVKCGGCTSRDYHAAHFDSCMTLVIWAISKFRLLLAFCTIAASMLPFSASPEGEGGVQVNGSQRAEQGLSLLQPSILLFHVVPAGLCMCRGNMPTSYHRQPLPLQKSTPSTGMRPKALHLSHSTPLSKTPQGVRGTAAAGGAAGDAAAAAAAAGGADAKPLTDQQKQQKKSRLSATTPVQEAAAAAAASKGDSAAAAALAAAGAGAARAALAASTPIASSAAPAIAAGAAATAVAATGAALAAAVAEQQKQPRTASQMLADLEKIADVELGTRPRTGRAGRPSLDSLAAGDEEDDDLVVAAAARHGRGAAAAPEGVRGSASEKQPQQQQVQKAGRGKQQRKDMQQQREDHEQLVDAAGGLRLEDWEENVEPQQKQDKEAATVAEQPKQQPQKQKQTQAAAGHKQKADAEEATAKPAAGSKGGKQERKAAAAAAGSKAAVKPPLGKNKPPAKQKVGFVLANQPVRLLGGAFWGCRQGIGCCLLHTQGSTGRTAQSAFYYMHSIAVLADRQPGSAARLGGRKWP